MTATIGMLDVPQARYSTSSSSSTRHPRRPPPSQASSPGVSPEIPFAGPPPYLSIYAANNSALPLPAGSSPIPSRASSPLPFLYSSAPSSASSELESDGEAPVLTRRRITPRERPPRWWFSQSTLRRRRRESGWFLRQVRRWTRAIVRSPFCPRQPWTIVRHSLAHVLEHASDPTRSLLLSSSFPYSLLRLLSALSMH